MKETILNVIIDLLIWLFFIQLTVACITHEMKIVLSGLINTLNRQSEKSSHTFCRGQQPMVGWGFMFVNTSLELFTVLEEVLFWYNNRVKGLLSEQEPSFQNHLVRHAIKILERGENPHEGCLATYTQKYYPDPHTISPVIKTSALFLEEKKWIKYKALYFNVKESRKKIPGSAPFIWFTPKVKSQDVSRTFVL